MVKGCRPCRGQCSLTRRGPPPEEASDRVERNADIAEYQRLVHLVERGVHPARDESLDQQAPSNQSAHEAADRGEFAQRYERAEIVEVIRRKRPAVEPRLHGFDQEQRLLACRLRARRHERLRAGFGPRTRGAVAKREDVGIVRRLQRRGHDQLVAASGFQAVEIAQPVGRLDARGPDHEIRRIQGTARGVHALRVDRRHALAGAHRDVELFEQSCRRLGDVFG